MKEEYDFSNGVRGKYLKKYLAGTNVVVLDPEIAAVFKSSKAVNEALRTIMRLVGRNKNVGRTRKIRRSR